MDQFYQQTRQDDDLASTMPYGLDHQKDIINFIHNMDAVPYPGAIEPFEVVHKLADDEKNFKTSSSPGSTGIDGQESLLSCQGSITGTHSLTTGPSPGSPELEPSQDNNWVYPPNYQYMSADFPEYMTSHAQKHHQCDAVDYGITRPQVSSKADKRSITSAFPNEELDKDHQRRRAKLGTSTFKGNKKRDQLACPFYMHNPQRYQECLKYALHRIKDVKQHIYRRHRQPDYYCARCSAVFETMAERDEHTRHANCTTLPMLRFEGISEDQRNRLNKSSCRALDIQNQWFEMWDILFPDQERPSSAFVGSYTEGIVPLLRSLWRDRRDQIMGCVLNKNGDGKVDISQLNNIMDALFHNLEAETSGSLSEYVSSPEAKPIECQSDAGLYQTIAPEFEAASEMSLEKFWDLTES